MLQKRPLGAHRQPKAAFLGANGRLQRTALKGFGNTFVLYCARQLQTVWVLEPNINSENMPRHFLYSQKTQIRTRDLF
jgi:hypothetical protein